MALILGILGSGGAAVGGGGSYESIATVTVGSGGASTVSFTSIPQTYTHLQIRGIARWSSSGIEGALVHFNSDTASNYSAHGIEAYGDSVSALSYTNFGGLYFIQPVGGTSLASAFAVTVTDILDYTNTNKYKTTRSLFGSDINGAGGRVDFVSGSWRNTNAITRIDMSNYGGSRNFAQYSEFSLYGIKGA